jgi:hypothetical protein
MGHSRLLEDIVARAAVVAGAVWRATPVLGPEDFQMHRGAARVQSRGKKAGCPTGPARRRLRLLGRVFGTAPLLFLQLYPTSVFPDTFSSKNFTP